MTDVNAPDDPEPDEPEASEGQRSALPSPTMRPPSRGSPI